MSVRERVHVRIRRLACGAQSRMPSSRRLMMHMCTYMASLCGGGLAEGGGVTAGRAAPGVTACIYVMYLMYLNVFDVSCDVSINTSKIISIHHRLLYSRGIHQYIKIYINTARYIRNTSKKLMYD
jgi:hypothetical protein